MSRCLFEFRLRNRRFLHTDVLTQMLMQLIVREKHDFAFSASERSNQNEEICFEFVVLILRIIKIQIWVRFMIIITFFVVWFLHFLFVLLDYVDAFFILIDSLILAFSFTKCETWRVCVVFTDYLQRLFWEWQNRSEFWEFFLEISKIWRWISIVSILIFETIVLLSIELTIEELLTWINILILIWEKREIRSNEIFWIILRSTKILKSISDEFELILWLRSNHFLSNIWHEIQLIQKFSNERDDDWFEDVRSKTSVQIISSNRQLIVNRVHIDCLDSSKNLLSEQSWIFFWSCVDQRVFEVLQSR
jgi:hypothetical protein